MILKVVSFKYILKLLTLKAVLFKRGLFLQACLERAAQFLGCSNMNQVFFGMWITFQKLSKCNVLFLDWKGTFVFVNTNNNKKQAVPINPLQVELDALKAQKEKLERELLAREELMQSMFSLLAEKKK